MGKFKIRNSFFTSLFILLSAVYALAQQGNIKGKIVDAEDNDPLVGVSVFLKGTTKGGTTDLEGNFLIKNISEGTHTLVISYVGYEDFSKPVKVASNEVADLGTLKLSSGALLLKEVEVSASIITTSQESKTPTAISTIKGREILEKLGSAEFPEMLKSTPGVYTSMGGGSLGAGSVVVRGYSSQNTAVMINGIPVNDMETGWVFWSNWAGLNDVTRYQQVQRGLGVSKLAVSSIGGTINIITNPTEMRKGIRTALSTTNGSYRNRLMVTGSTGLMKGDWAVTASGSRRWGEGYRKGIYTDSWAYFLSAYKKIGENHQLVFTGFGAPQERGRGWDANKADYERYGDFRNGDFYNKAWGYYNGEKKNRSVNRYHKPQFMLNHYWDISEKIKLTNSAYWSFGRGGGTNIQRSFGSSSLNSSTFKDENGQLIWDTVYTRNTANIETIDSTSEGTITGARSLYYLEERRNDHNWYGFISSLRIDLKENLSLVGGIDGRLYKGFHFATVLDLLGGDFIMDKDSYKYGSDGDNADHNILTPNRVARIGDVVRYNYVGTVNWLGVFGQVEYNWKHFDFFLTGNLSRTSYWREGKFQHELFAESGVGGLGKSPPKEFINYTAKGGVNYRITGRHNVFVNAGYFTRAPFLVNAFIDARLSNQFMDNLTSEKISAAEAGYSYRSRYLSGNLNVYYTIRNDWMFTESYYSPELDGYKDFLASGVDAIHKGIEFDLKVKPYNSLELTGMFTLGNWMWQGNPTAVVRDNNTLGVDTIITLYIDDYPVGDAAQITAAMGARYQFPFYAYFGADWNFYSNLYTDYNPALRTNPLVTSEDIVKLNDYYTFDIYGGKSFKIKKWNHLMKVQFNINNVLDNLYLVEGRESPGSSGVDYYFDFGRPLTYFMSIIYVM